MHLGRDRSYVVFNTTFSETISSDMVICVAINALVADKAFAIPSASAISALNTAKMLVKWIPTKLIEVESLQNQLQHILSPCIKSISLSSKANASVRSKMWQQYHSVRTSTVYLDAWKAFLQKSSTIHTEAASLMFCQYVGHQLFLHLIKSNCTLSTNDAPNHHIPLELTDEEIQALRYTAGYIPRSLKKKILKSSRDHKQKQDLVLCLEDLLADETEEPSESAEWLTALNRGGLLCVNNMTFELFYAMELEFRKHVGGEGINFDAAEMMERNEDVLLCWNIISASWDEECSSSLLQMIIKLWITIRGYSLSSACIEKYKAANKKTVQKSKSLRKELAKE